MEYYYGIEEVNIKKKRSLAIGVFDGIHLGHRKIIKSCLEEARLRKIESTVLTFYPHPDEVLNPNKKIFHLTGLDSRKEVIESLGVKELLVVEFNIALAKTKADDFLSMIIENLTPEIIVIGENFRFGAGQEGNPDFLVDYGNNHGFQVRIIPIVEVEKRRVSSTWIRKVISEGNLMLASALLGRQPFIIGQVVKGRGLGQKIGFHTINLETEDIGSIPKKGVYAGQAIFDELQINSVINVGTRPTFRNNDRIIVEAHLIEWQGDLYEKKVRIKFISRIRDEIAFPDSQALASQIKEDILTAKQILMN